MSDVKEVRISVANLAIKANLKGLSGPYFGILNPKKREKGELIYQALGGAVELTETGANYLANLFDAREFSVDEKTGITDARFIVDSWNVMNVFNWLIEWGRYPDFVMDPARDSVAELTGKEHPGLQIFTREEAADIRLNYLGSIGQAQPKDGIGTSSRASAAIPTYRLFLRHSLVMSQELHKKFWNSQMVAELSEEELATTEGGGKRGNTKNGTAIADNLFL